MNVARVCSFRGATPHLHFVRTVCKPDESAGRDQKGSIYLVFEYLDYDMAGLLESTYILKPVEIKLFLYQLLQALAYMHENDFVHRDLKTSNLLVSSDHVLKLGDFGLGRQLDRRPTKMTTKVVTQWYRPPELLMGENMYRTEVDMWSIG